MRRGSHILAVIAAAIAAVTVAPGALAATPKDICDDLADGTLNGTYSAGDIAAYVAALGSDPTIQGYCTPFTPPAPETPAPQPPAPEQPGQQPPAPEQPAPQTPATPPTGGVGPAESPTLTPSEGVVGATKAQGAPLGQTKSAGTLPFTGTELTIFALVGLALVAAGLLLRSTAKDNT